MNFLSRDLNWFLLGYSFNYINKNKIKQLSFKLLIFLYLFGAFLTIVPILFNTAIDFSCIGIIISAITIFTFALKVDNKSYSKVLEYIGKEMSLNMYIFHGLIAGVLSFILKHLINKNVKSTFYFPLIVFFCTVVFCYILDIILKRKNYKVQKEDVYKENIKC